MDNILLVDDETRMLDLLSLYLLPKGFHCTKATSGKEALKLLEKKHFDLVLLDIMMPEMNGWETCQKIRGYSNIPIIMLTARNQKYDIIKGLKQGADDYITKPFDEDELLARIESLLRRAGHRQRIGFKDIVWDEYRHIVSVSGNEMSLTPIEFSLLGVFLKNQQYVFTREQLIEIIWGYETDTEGRTVDSHIRNLREKLRKANFPIEDYLITVYGVGYRWKDEGKNL